MKTKLLVVLLLVISNSLVLTAQSTVTSAASDSVLITVILKHQQSKSLKEIEQKQEENKYWDIFPPKQARVVSWYAVMGLGQIITLQIAPKDLRALNRAIGEGAWGAFSTEIYPAYDYVPVYKERMQKRKSQ